MALYLLFGVVRRIWNWSTGVDASCSATKYFELLEPDVIRRDELVKSVQRVIVGGVNKRIIALCDGFEIMRFGWYLRQMVRHRNVAYDYENLFENIQACITHSQIGSHDRNIIYCGWVGAAGIEKLIAMDIGDRNIQFIVEPGWFYEPTSDVLDNMEIIRIVKRNPFENHQECEIVDTAVLRQYILNYR